MTPEQAQDVLKKETSMIPYSVKRRVLPTITELKHKYAFVINSCRRKHDCQEAS